MIAQQLLQRGTRHEKTAYEEFIQSVVPTPYVSNPILIHPVTYTNTCPAGMLIDPLDPTKFIFYRGEFIGPTTVGARIRLFTGGDLDDPYNLGTDQGLVFTGSETYDLNGCRFGQPIIHPSNGQVWYYYVGVDNTAALDWRICRAISTDGGRTFTKQGVVLDFNNTNEKSLSGPSIIIENGTWYMAYTAWDGIGGTDQNPGDSKLGIWLATSTDGITWTKTNTNIVTITGFDNVEDCLLRKLNDTYVIVFNADLVSNTWGMYVAESTVINATFTKVKKNKFDGVACPNILRFNDGFEYFYYQDNTAPATNDIFVAKLIPIV